MADIKYPTWHLKRTPLYHISHLNNIEKILKSGGLRAKNTLDYTPENIALNDIQSKRSAKQVALPPGGLLHDYVPFYLAPRSPMLYSYINSNYSDNKAQEKIIYFVTYAELLHQNNIPYVFYDQHAVKQVASCFNDIKDLDKIAWDIFYEEPLTGDYSTVWKDEDDINHPLWFKRKALRQAEFLVQKKLDLQHIVSIGTMTQKANDEVLRILTSAGVEIQLEIQRDWYY